jgi:hypothetical protein
MKVLTPRITVVLGILMPFALDCIPEDIRENDSAVHEVGILDCMKDWPAFLKKLEGRETGVSGCRFFTNAWRSYEKTHKNCIAAADSSDLCDAYAEKQKACATEVVDYRTLLFALDLETQRRIMGLDADRQLRFQEQYVGRQRKRDLERLETGAGKCATNLSPIGEALSSLVRKSNADNCLAMALYIGVRRIRKSWSECFNSSSCTEYVECSHSAKDMQRELWGDEW